MGGLKTLYAKDGTPLADIRTSATRSWILKGVGEAVVYVPTSNTKCRQEYLEYGNYIVIKHDQLPDWVGVIDTPRVWHNGYVEVRAYEPAFLFNYRFAPLKWEYTGTPGEKIIALIDQANIPFDTLIRPGLISLNGDALKERMESRISVHIAGLCKRYAMEWRTYPLIDANQRLSILLDFAPQIGVETDAELIQGRNILFGDSPLEESGELINYMEGMADDGAGGIAVYPYSVPTLYGLRMKREKFTGITVDALKTLTENAVESKKQPSISAPLTVANVGGLFGNINVGNTLKYIYKNIGFNNGSLGAEYRVRIAGFRYDEDNDTCELFTTSAL
jgi:hypothetical protein